MKIVDNRKKNQSMKFSELKGNTPFQFCDTKGNRGKDVWFKLSYASGGINAVNLDQGCPGCVGNTDLVVPIDASSFISKTSSGKQSTRLIE